MKKLLLSIMTLACGMSMNAQTTGTATRTGDVEVNWVQLWDKGPKFAVYNVGAENNKATDLGGHYCWGSSIDMDSNLSFKEGDDDLTGSDDTATNLWGSNWRMPSDSDLRELQLKCNSEWTSSYNGTGVAGKVFTGKGEYRSNSIFLPAAGVGIEGEVSYRKSQAYYWSSSALVTENPNNKNSSYMLNFTSSQNSNYYDRRTLGCSVRAVLAIVPDVPTAIEGVADNAISTQRGGKKVINDGKLIIIGNNGKMYNAVGIEIKK